jgi:hypothetical protein
MWVFREWIGSTRNPHPGVGRRIIDLWDGGNTDRTAVIPRHDQHTTVRECYRGRIPATVSHRAHLGPATCTGVEDVRVWDTVKIDNVPPSNEHATVSQ